MAACGIDLILNAEVSGTTSTHIGSARILTGSNTYAAFRGMFGPSVTATASIEVRRFTNAASITTITSSGIGLQDISASEQTIAAFGLVDDWYDFYASGSGASVSSLIKGIKVTLY
jgi:hypothetical protein